MSGSTLVIGVHGSGLARRQAEDLGAQLTDAGNGYEVELRILAELGGSRSGLHDDHLAEHRSEIEQLHSRLRSGEIDVAIHRGFDLRGNIPDELCIGAVLARQNPYDVLLAPGEVWLDELDPTHRVGVVQLRARAQLLDYRPDLDWTLTTGDAGDWLAALIDGDLDALIAPGAAIEQLGLQERVCEIFPPELLVPAPGSGVLVCLAREEDSETRRRLKPLHDPDTLREYAAEVALVECLGGGWEKPIGVLARFEDGMLHMAAMVAAPDGGRILRDHYTAEGDDPDLAAEEFAALLLHAGASELLEGSPGDGEGGLPVPAAKPARRPEPAGQESWEDDFDFEEFAEAQESDEDDEEY